ncbi:MAG: hypothetical protein HY436_00840 [Candidatus Liptonbacteria bacterium]|nr:hypothetical protein [Candidatus Liptonbacteria bacterium]
MERSMHEDTMDIHLEDSGHNGRRGRKGAGIAVLAVAALFVLAYLFVSVPRGRGERDLGTVNAVVREALTNFEAPLLSGTVVALRSDGFTLSVPSVLGVHIPEDADLLLREVAVTAETEVVQEVKKPDLEFREEAARYRPSGGSPPPSPVVFQAISYNELKVGDRVAVEANGSDLKTALQITASRVTRKQ